MISQTDPESMTAEERRREVAAILANGLLRRLRAAESAALSSSKTASKESITGRIIAHQNSLERVENRP